MIHCDLVKRRNTFNGVTTVMNGDLVALRQCQGIIEGGIARTGNADGLSLNVPDGIHLCKNTGKTLRNNVPGPCTCSNDKAFAGYFTSSVF